MAIESPQAHRERVVRVVRRRVRPRARLAGQLMWTAAYLTGGAVALAEGHRATALIGLAGGAIFILLALLAAFRRRRLQRRSWRASSPPPTPGPPPSRPSPPARGRPAPRP